MKEEIITEAKSWGARINVPSSVLDYLKIAPGDKLTWKPSEREGKRVVILEKRELETIKNDNA